MNQGLPPPLLIPTTTAGPVMFSALDASIGIVKDISQSCTEYEPTTRRQQQAPSSSSNTSATRDTISNISAHCEVYLACVTDVLSSCSHTRAVCNVDASLLSKLFTDSVKIVVCASELGDALHRVQSCAALLLCQFLQTDTSGNVGFGSTFWGKHLGHSKSDVDSPTVGLLAIEALHRMLTSALRAAGATTITSTNRGGGGGSGDQNIDAINTYLHRVLDGMELAGLHIGIEGYASIHRYLLEPTFKLAHSGPSPQCRTRAFAAHRAIIGSRLVPDLLCGPIPTLQWNRLLPFRAEEPENSRDDSLYPPGHYMPIHIPNRTPHIVSDLSPSEFLRTQCNVLVPLEAFTAIDVWLGTYLGFGEVSLDPDVVDYPVRRGVAVECLLGLFRDLPMCNGLEDHPAAGLVGVMVEVYSRKIRDVLCACLEQATLPFFRLGTRLYETLVQRVFYYLQRDLHGVLTNVLIPLAFSSSTPFEYRACIFASIETILTDPITLTALYINCDCSPDFGDGGALPSVVGVAMAAGDTAPTVSGYLASVVPFLLTYLYTNFAVCQSSGTITSEQQRLLQHQVLRCVVGMISALWNFISRPLAPSELLLTVSAQSRYSPQTIQQLLRNKQLLTLLRGEVRIEGIKRLKPVAMQWGLISGSAESLALLLYTSPPSFGDELKHLLILALLKSPFNAEVLEAFAGMQTFAGVPLDGAFKHFVCSLLHPENQPKDKQLPESQAWSHFQTVFGTEYSNQNRGSSYGMSPYAADALAGSLLFLHSTSHNPNASFVFEKEDWISKTKESMGVAFSSEELGNMYDRTSSAPWGSLQATTAGSGGGPTSTKAKKAAAGGAGGGGRSGEDRRRLLGGEQGGGYHHARTVSNALLMEGSPTVDTLIRQGTGVRDDLSKGTQTRLESKIRVCVGVHRKQMSTLDGAGLLTPPYIRPVYAEHATDISSMYLPTLLACLYVCGRTNPYPDAQLLVLEGRSGLDSLCGALDMDSGRLHAEAARITTTQLHRPLAIPLQPLSLSSIAFLL